MSRKVLFIAPQPYFQWRGSPIRVAYNMQALTELGYEVDLLCLPYGEPRPFSGLRVYRTPRLPGVKDMPIGPSVWKLPYACLLFKEALRLVKAHHYDVIHAVEDAGMMAGALARRCGAKVIFEKHSDPSSYKAGALRNLIMWAYGRVEARSVRCADAVIGTGPALVEQAEQWLRPGCKAHHIFDIPSSLIEPTPSVYEKIRSSWSTTGSEVFVLYVGSFAVYQGIDLLFSAIPEVLRRNHQIHLMVIGGSSGEIRIRREQLADKEGHERVVFLGKVDPNQLPDYLAAADILLSPRLSGSNTPLKLLDYLKVGRCILATDIWANRQILNEDTAFFVSPDPDDFAKGMLRLADDPDLRERLGARGKHLIDDQYNFQQFKQRLGQVYEAL